MTVTSIHPNGSAVTRIHPQDETTSGGGGGGDNYTTFNSPWVAEGPWQIAYFGDFYATGANPTFFVADAPVTETTF
jgi:hypothetical protein